MAYTNLHLYRPKTDSKLVISCKGTACDEACCRFVRQYFRYWTIAYTTVTPHSVEALLAAKLNRDMTNKCHPES